MNGRDRTKEELLEELSALQSRVHELESLEAEHTRARELLKQSQEKFLKAFELNPEPISITEIPTGQILEVNDAFLKIAGYTRDEAVGKTTVELGLWKGEADRDKLVDTLSRDGHVRNMEIEFVSRTGETIVGLVSAEKIEFMGKQLMLAIVMDITARKSAEQKLKASERYFRSLLYNLHEEILVIDRDYLITDVNHTFLHSKGAGWDEVVGRRCYEVSHGYTLPCENMGEECLLGEVFDTGEPRTCRHEHLTSGGGKAWVDILLSPLKDEEGNVTGVIEAVRDVSDLVRAEDMLKRSEKRFRTLYREARQREQLYESLIRSTPDAVVIYNLNGEAVYTNPAFRNIFGFTIEDVIGKTIPFVPDYEEAKTRDCFDRVLKGEAVSGFETHRLTKRGDLLNIAISASCYYDHKGRPAGIVAILRDVTESKQIESQLLQAQKMEAVGTLAGGIAHDFNNLLQAIQGFADLLLLETDGEDPGYHELMEIFHAAKKGGELTQQLLTFSRKVESKSVPVNLNSQVKRLRKMLERTIPKMIKIELKLDDRLKIVSADPVQVEQVLVNLALNAKDAMQERGTLTIRTKNVYLDEEFSKKHLGMNPGDYVLLSMTDTGHGMDREAMENIFDPFYSTKEVGKGTGLGLSMVYGIVKNHQGHITCTSEVGVGSTFNIYLPALESLEEHLEELRSEEEPPGGTETVLIIDDEEFIRGLAEKTLSRFGYKVLLAEDGERALDIFQEQKDDVDLIILDLIMPGMGGRKCLEEILKIDPSARVVIASGYSPEGQSKDQIEAHTKGIIKKPFDVKALLNEVRRAIDGS